MPTYMKLSTSFKNTGTIGSSASMFSHGLWGDLITFGTCGSALLPLGDGATPCRGRAGVAVA